MWAQKPFDRAHAWVDLLLRANHSDGWASMIGRESVEVKRGQILTSTVQLSEEWGWSRGSVRLFLKQLETSQQISQLTTRRYTILSVVKYDDYQEIPKQKSQVKSQQKANRKPTDSQLKAMNNNENKNNNETNEEYIDASFDKFWEAYPKRPGNPKQGARECWNKLIRMKVDPDDLIKAAVNYCRYRAGENPAYTAHAKTFLGPTKAWEEWVNPSAESFYKNGSKPESAKGINLVAATDKYKDVGIKVDVRRVK